MGYGTSNSASNCIPRMVEYLKGKIFRSVSAAKYHTIVLGADGEVSWCSLKLDFFHIGLTLRKIDRSVDVILFSGVYLGSSPRHPTSCCSS